MTTYNCTFWLKYPEDRTHIEQIEADTPIQADGKIKRSAIKELGLKKHREIEYECHVLEVAVVHEAVGLFGGNA